MELPKVQFLKAALYYAELGYPIHPVKEYIKFPYLNDWPNRASTKESIIRAWAYRWPNANVGIVTTPLVVFDFDTKCGKNIIDLVAEVEEEFGPFPKSPTVSTPSGGLHKYYLRPPGLAVRSRVGFRPGLDIRADVGFVLAPPSVLPNGEYSWEYGHGIHEIPMAMLPEHLAIALTEDNKPKPSKVSGYWTGLIRNGITEGRRNDSIAKLSGYLIHTLGFSVASDLIIAANRTYGKPPLPDDEVERTVQSIMNAHKRNHRGGK